MLVNSKTVVKPNTKKKDLGDGEILIVYSEVTEGQKTDHPPV